ncbi:transforming acidic coiled-coil-containing protein 3 [Nannospalax galili]|uniref:transforming acidic coiled-coil-containing protein 3 n=1 Tax=Nannospalax galili TaxID=1026970 RepID=UPI0004ECFD8E|nr:transforming acidic coiled-coil-containing protein 3 [Nannospalax galili]XP_029423541.1 transforming acidic coiled-coil-containing protein 3 [Nannospalax galili]
MSLHILNDENVPSEKNAENCDFLFSQPELTGRSSVLRPSQKENVPPKNQAKVAKVTFQTPLRDPQTHKILSPSMTSKLEAPFALDDSVGLENCPYIWLQKENQQFTREVDKTATSGVLQKQASIDASLGNENSAFEGSGSNKHGSAPLDDLSYSSSSQSPGSPKNLVASPGQWPDSPGQALKEGISIYSSDKSIPSTCEILEDPAETVSPHTEEASPGTLGESSSLAALPVAAASSGPSSESPQRTTSPTDLADEAPACPKDVDILEPTMDIQSPPHVCSSGSENSVPAGPLQASGATDPSPQEEATGQMVIHSRNDSIRLEFDFSDDTTKRVSPPKRLALAGLQPFLKESDARQEQAPKEAEESDRAGEKVECLQPVSHGSYHLDWDKLDDPNFNPFGGDSKPKDKKAQLLESPKSRSAAVAEQQSARPTDMENSASHQLPPAPADTQHLVEMAAKSSRAEGRVQEGILNSSGTSALISCLGSELMAPSTEPVPEPSQQGPETTLDLKEESFRDPAEVLGTSAEVDYLEQFGTSSFKESAWRKQSLYLKFDPLLKDSPLRPVPVISLTNSTQDRDEPVAENPLEAKLVELDFLGALDVPVPGPPLCVIEPGGLLPAGPIVDMLQYSQKDLDAAVNAAQQENLELRSKCEELNTKYLEMGKIVDGFEKIVYQSMEEAEKQKELAQDKIQKVLREKDQLTADLSSMEKSFSDLFKRFEKQKEVIEGYRKNEDSLKKCVEEYIVRIEKEGQRYQALKAHAEEKLRLANEEIAQVRSKAQAEALAFQASLRKAQMQIHSLEKTVEQKTKENDELTRLCDDLISKMEKI